jgi:hypothetical protein
MIFLLDFAMDFPRILFRPIHLQSALRSRGGYGKQAALRGVGRLLGMTPRAIEVNVPRFRMHVECW